MVNLINLKSEFVNNFIEMKNNLNHWSNYWKNGSLTSLPQDFIENYDGEINEFWNKCFSHLGKHSEILDLCTGNCAIALLAVKFSDKNKLSFNVTAVDAAKIELKSLATKYTHLKEHFRSIKLISECYVEDIELDDNKFDLITSQYGIEYCDWTGAAKQTNRLLKPGGRLVIISHATSTDIMSYMIQEQNEYRFLNKLNFFVAFKNYFDRKSNYKVTMDVFENVYKTMQQSDKDMSTNLFSGVLNFLRKVLSFKKDVFIAHEDTLRMFYTQHTFAYSRLKDLFSVSKKIKSNPDWYLTFEKYGLKLDESGIILQAGIHNAGNYYIFSKYEVNK